MDFGLASYSFGFLAGLLSTLSPCVLPIVPILLSAAANAHRFAPFALAFGLALSYAIVGTALAWAGSALALDTSLFRNAGAVILGMLGLVLMSSSMQQRFSTVTHGISDVGNRFINGLRLDSLWGQFALGLVLGVVWSPCVGPTLGAAVLLASQGSHLPQVALLMAIFGLGAALPVVALSLISRTAITRIRGRLVGTGKIGKIVLGATMLGLAILILTNTDKTLEAWLVDQSPLWLTKLTTRF
jgi:cytochrome c-type biogenesis protein